MLYANTIEFAGEKSVINSYSDHPLIIPDRERQLDEWRARYPNATVKGEYLPINVITDMVAEGHKLGVLRSKPHEIGRKSNGEAVPD